MKDPGVVDAGACSGKVRQEADSCGAHGSRLNLKNVVSHLLGRDTSLRWMYTSAGVIVKAKAHRRGDNLAITITQRQRT